MTEQSDCQMSDSKTDNASGEFLVVTKQNPTKISVALQEMTNLYIHSNIQQNPSANAEKNGTATTYCCVIKDHILSGHVSMKDMFFKMLDQCSLQINSKHVFTKIRRIGLNKNSKIKKYKLKQIQKCTGVNCMAPDENNVPSVCIACIKCLLIITDSMLCIGTGNLQGKTKFEPHVYNGIW